MHRLVRLHHGSRRSCSPSSSTLRSIVAAGAVAMLGAACAPAPGSEVEPPAAPARPSTSTPARGYATPGERLGIGGCRLFPADHAWHASIGSLEVLDRSAAMIAAAEDLPLRGSFGSGIWMGSRNGVPVNVVDGRTTRRLDVVVANDRGSTGAHLDVPVPDAPRFEGWPGKAWDAHLIVVDTSTCESRELLNVRDPSDDPLGLGGGRWYADSAATFDLSSNAAPGRGATAAHSSLVAGLIRFDEIAAGEIDHALSASLSTISAGEPVWPAMGSDGRSDAPDAIPMGSWLRLRSDADMSRLGPQARIVAEALRDHGAIVSDTGPGFVVRGEPDLRWDDDDIDTLGELTMDDFEIVDAAPMMVSPDSYQLRR